MNSSRLQESLKLSIDSENENFNYIDRQELDRIKKDNLRLYSKIIKMNNSPQFGYLGLNKSRLNSQEKAVEAGLFMAQNLKNKSKDHP